MNKVIMMGRLTRDPEVRYSQGASQTAIGRFYLAVDRRFKREGEPNADFFNCTTFGKQAEFVEKYLRKGTKVVITGRVQNYNYIDDRTNNKVYSVQIIVEEIEFAESKNTAGQQNNPGRQQDAPVESDGVFLPIPDGIEEELPFN